MLAPLLGLLFLAFELGLRFTHRSDATVSTRADRGSLAFLWITIGAAVGLAAIMPQFIPQADFHLGALGTGLVALGFVFGLALRVWAIALLGRFFTVDVAIRHDHSLMTYGPYAWVRHPSYSGLLVMFAALGALFENVASIFALLVPVGLALARRIGIEERALAAAFGEAWTAYASRTRRLVPFVY
jgi:protein-S-isoprenylcysteine O-methyltransferase